MATAFTQLFMGLIRDQRAVYIDGNFPAKCLIETVIFGGRRQIFVAPHHMGDAHQMIVHYIGKIVSGVSVGLNQYHIVQFCVVYCDISIDLIMEGRGAAIGIILANHIGDACGQFCFHFFFGQVKTVLVIDANLLACHHLF